MSSHDSTSNHFALGGADTTKRSADDAKLDPNSQQAAKRKRPQSCDTCRSRKIKCVRLQVDGLDASADNRCVQCRAIDAKCTFDYVPKRPGPQSSFAKTARREAEAQAQAQAKATASSHSHSQHAAGGPSHSRSSTAGFGNTPGSAPMAGPSPHVQYNQPGGSPSDDSWYRALAAQNFASGGGSGAQTRSSSWSGGTNFDAYLNNSMLAMTPSHFAGMTGASPFDFSPHNMGNLSGPSPSMSVSNASSATPGSYAGSSSWHPAPRSDAGSSRSAAPLASLQQQQPQLQSQPQAHQQQSSSHSQIDQMHHSFDLAAGLVGGENRSTPLPLPIPSFSRVQSPAPPSATLPQVNEHVRPQQHQQQPSQQHHQHQQQAPSFGATSSSHNAKERTSSAIVNSSRKPKNGPSLSSMYCGPVLRPRSLEDIAPRQTFLSVVSLYFHYLWPLLPIVDRPTFSHDLLNRRDERDEAFLAFVLSLTSYTLIQCPRTVIPAPWTVYRRLHRICHLTSRRMQPRVYDPPQLLHVNTLYCDHIYLGTVGKTNAANAVLAEAVRVAYTLGLHDERKNDSSRSVAPYGLDASSFAHYRAPTANAVDRELRKRMFWVLHGSSTTIAMLQDEPALIHAIDACVDLPLAVDEEALANPGYIQRVPSVLSGFLTVTRLHQVMLELLESYRRDRRFPIDDLSVARSRIRYLADVLRRLQQAIDDMPDELRKPVYTHAPPEPIRRPGSALPALESVQQRQQDQPHHAPLLQAIGFDAATQTALGNHLSGTSPWPWPAETFTREGLPNAEARSSNNSSANHSPRLSSGDGSLPSSTRTDGATTNAAVGVDGGQPTHQVLTPPSTMTPRPSTAADAALTMVDLVNVFRPTPPPSSTPVLSPMCTMHANIVTTESLIRFLVVEYRELVLVRIRDLKLRNPSPSFAATGDGEDMEGEPWQDAAANMLRVFNSLPLDALASNGHSLMSKIIYVVSALLNRAGGKTTAGTLGGFGYMSSLLATLTRLEQTRKDDSASELEEDSLSQDTEERGGGDDGDDDDEGRGGRRRRGDGSGNGSGNGNGNEKNNPAPPRRDRDGDRDNNSTSRSRMPDPTHHHLSNPNPSGATNHSHNLSNILPNLASPSSASTSSPPSNSNSNSTSTSTVNTATTTPTSEVPPAHPHFFNDKLALPLPHPPLLHHHHRHDQQQSGSAQEEKLTSPDLTHSSMGIAQLV
ncbi:uncharacterized protein UTRI_06096 [Ustilago trichophora]|uniref:Zn(2)-C6 fungal-type domain-containing protein n=1 Tax=Ustilago trichophora TaxID=86804 RepID=A0A5C3EHF0_9BASI|nr:uncharacterized protein UTRI_06096 [Ustilago trichophora]